MRLSIVGSIACVALAVALAGCAPVQSKTNLAEVAQRTKLSNITTGDGTFENYTATGHHTSKEIGIGIGLPGIGKFIELYPGKTNEDLLASTAEDAKNLGADAMINVTPSSTLYTGIPFIIVGIYVDSNEGTGIKRR
jgi:uncharacterized protein YbjQ (UPF0145 family)